MPKAAASAREVPEGPDGLPMPGACWNPDDTAADDASISAAAHPAAVRLDEAGPMLVAAVLGSRPGSQAEEARPRVSMYQLNSRRK